MRNAGKPTAIPITPATTPPNTNATRERHAEFLGQDRGGVGADRHEAGLAERHLAGLEGQIEAVGGDDVDAGENQQRARVAVEQTVEHRRRYLSSGVRAPNRPVGR